MLNLNPDTHTHTHTHTQPTEIQPVHFSLSLTHTLAPLQYPMNTNKVLLLTKQLCHRERNIARVHVRHSAALAAAAKHPTNGNTS